MSNQILVLSEEYIKRIFVGLGEVPAKFSHEVILAIESQLKAAETEYEKLVAVVENHIAPLKAKIAADAAKAKSDVTADINGVKTEIANVQAAAGKAEEAGQAIAKVL